MRPRESGDLLPAIANAEERGRVDRVRTGMMTCLPGRDVLGFASNGDLKITSLRRTVEVRGDEVSS
jgi:hypothetical protein